MIKKIFKTLKDILTDIGIIIVGAISILLTVIFVPIIFIIYGLCIIFVIWPTMVVLCLYFRYDLKIMNVDKHIKHFKEKSNND